MKKARVALFGKPGSIIVDQDATEGAVFGVNLRNADGSLVTAEQFAATGVAIEGIATTDALPEGTRNLYYTDARADARIAVHVALSDPHTQYQPNLLLQDEGSDLATSGAINTVNFTGAGVTASETGGVVTVDIPGGGGSGSGGFASTVATTTASTTDAGPGTGSFPLDNTIPQITEGTAYAAADTTYTPADAGSLLEVVCVISYAAVSQTSHSTFALFRDSDANALDAAFIGINGGQATAPIVLRAVVPANAATATTFKLRYGAQASTGYTTYLLSLGGTNYMGAAASVTMTVREILP